MRLFQLGETVSLNKQRQRVATLMKLCRNQSKLAPVREPIPGLFQKVFHSKHRQSKALAKLRDGGHVEALKKAQLPPKYQPTRELIIALEEQKDTLPKTISEGMIGVDATLGVLRDLFGGDGEDSVTSSTTFTPHKSGVDMEALGDAARNRHIAQQQAGITAMTDGILQKSYLVERFLEELEAVGNFSGAERRIGSVSITK